MEYWVLIVLLFLAMWVVRVSWAWYMVCWHYHQEKTLIVLICLLGLVIGLLELAKWINN
jgi:hypothetical protein